MATEAVHDGVTTMTTQRDSCPRCGWSSNVFHLLFGMYDSEAAADLQPWERLEGCLVGYHDRSCEDCAYVWSSDVHRGGEPVNRSTLASLPGVLGFVAEVHGFQRDKAERPYVGHLMRVWRGVWRAGGSDHMQMAALLHDIIEDQPVTAEGLTALGAPAEVVRLVVLLTRRRDVPDERYYAAIASDPAARTIKLADIEDNTDPVRLALLPDEKRDYLVEKYAKARALLSEG